MEPSRRRAGDAARRTTEDGVYEVTASFPDHHDLFREAPSFFVRQAQEGVFECVPGDTPG